MQNMFQNIFSCFDGFLVKHSKAYKASHLQQIGYEEFKQGNFERALDLYNQNLQILIKSNDKMNIEIAKAHVEVAEAYNCLERCDEAFEHLQKALLFFKRTWGESHSFVSRIYCDLGLIFYYRGKNITALEYFSKSRGIREAYLKKEIGSNPEKNRDLQLATILNLTGWVLDALKRHDEAIEVYNKALKIYLSEIEDETPDIASLYNNIGLAYSGKFDYQKALEMYSKSLSIFQKTLGGDHPRVATALNNIGIVYISLDDLPKAEENFQKALEIDKKNLGENNPKLAKSYQYVGMTQLSQKKKESTYFFKKALELRKKNNTSEKIGLTSNLECYGCSIVCQNQYLQGLDIYQKAMILRNKGLGQDRASLEFWDFKRLLDEIEKSIVLGNFGENGI